jgi:hypothetical protein
MVPELESRLESEPSTEESEQPLYEIYFRLHSALLQLATHCRVILFQHNFKTSTNTVNKLRLQTEQFPHESISQYQVAEHVESSNFA